MESTEDKVQEQVVKKSKGQLGEVVIEKRTGRKAGLSKLTITVILILAVIVLADVAFILIRQGPGRAEQGHNLAVAVALPNAEKLPAAVRYASSSGGQQPTTVQPSPSTISQAIASTQMEIESSREDSKMEALAVEKISEDLELRSVVTTVRNARVVLSGGVSSADAKTRAGQLAQTVLGVKSVDNNIVVHD